MSYLITLEGGEGSGKTTVLNMLVQALEERGIPVIQTREPGGIDIAEQIRKVILDRANTKMDPRTEALLYAAARRQHLIEKVLPALESGKVVLCDRYVDSSLVYQGYARGLGMKEIYTINQFAIEGYMPDLTLYFDVDPEIGLSRIKRDEHREINRLDVESMKFHYKVREGYQLLCKQEPDRITVIDAEKELNQVFNEALEVVFAFIEKKERTVDQS